MKSSIFIILVLSVLAYYYTMRYNMHMFQLNGYKNGEHIQWIKKNKRKQWILIYGLVLGVLVAVVRNILLDIWAIISLWMIILVYKAHKNLNTKKKFVYTPRIKRLIVTDIMISLISIYILVSIGSVDNVGGCALVLVSMQIFLNVASNIVNSPMEKIINQYYIRDAKKKLKEIPNLKIIGVTGSYGKTSVKFYLQTLLQDKYNTLVTPESFNTPMGVVRTIRESLKSTHEVFVCEMGARHIGDIKEICDIVEPNYGVITSIGPQHLETFFNMENISNTKFELADALPKDGLIFLNGDNEYIQEKADAYKNKILYYSEHQGKGYYAQDILVSQYGTDFTVVTPTGETERFQMKLIGMHNVINVVGAIAVAHTMGMSLQELIVPVRRIQPVEHRMQIKEYGSVTIVDDAYNSNPIGSKAAVETLAMFDGMRILITPGMVELGDKEEEYNYKFGLYAADCCDYILLVGKKHIEPIKEGVLYRGFDENKCKTFDRVEDAISYAYTIKGESHKYILLENDLPDNY